MKYYFFILLAFASAISDAQIRRLLIKNVSDTTLEISVHSSFSPEDPGQPLFTSISLGSNATSSEIRIDAVPQGKWLHTVIYKQNGSKVVLDSYQAGRDENRTYIMNVGAPQVQTTDSQEIEQLNQFIVEQKELYSNQLLKTINITASAPIGIQEYLGAIIIVDTSSLITTTAAIKDMYTPRELDIVVTPRFDGRTYNREYTITREFSGSMQSSVPAAFNANLNYNSAALHKVKLQVRDIGAVTLVSSGITPIDLLIKLDTASQEPITNSIAVTLLECNTCILTQITTVFAHNGVIASKESFNSSEFAFSANSASVVTADGGYRRTNQIIENDYISPQLLSVGIVGINLSTRFKQAMLVKYRQEEKELTQILNDANFLKKQKEDALEVVRSIITSLITTSNSTELTSAE